MKRDEMSIGFATVPVMNPEAIRKLVTFREKQKQAVIVGTYVVKNKDEKRQYVDSIVNGKR